MPDIPFMRAHGHVPGPTQRPVTAGLIDGAAASTPALVLLWFSGTIEAMQHALGMTVRGVMALEIATLVLAGALYGRIFGRAANDMEGGWLFGISYGFLAWMLGPATILEWILQQPVAVGSPAMLLCAAHLLYGLVLGLLFPKLHSLLHRRL